jgi:phospholipid/cholesterol/gamma-HCH transport system permease protein
MFYRATLRDDSLQLTLQGDWVAAQLGQIEQDLQALQVDACRQIVIDMADDLRLELSGAWLLHEFVERWQQQRLQIDYPQGMPATLKLVVDTLDKAGPDFVRPESNYRPVSALGRNVVDRAKALRAGLAFIGEIMLRFLGGLFTPRHWRPTSIVRHVYDTGITAIPIVALIAFLISVIIAYMGAQQLRQFGADIFVVDLVTVGVLRELGVLLTAIIVAGRSGSAFAAEIGAMKLNQEIDALNATGVQAIEVLILPRLIGLIIALPLLTVIADVVGVLGGALLCHMLLDMPLIQYFQRAEEAIGVWTFWVGLIKAPVFAVLIAMAGTYRGLQVRGSSRELGRLTTVAVVQSIFLVILADALFAVLFMEMGI